VPVAVDVSRLPDFAAVNPFDRLLVPGGIAVLMSDLEDLLVLGDGLRDLVALVWPECERLLSVDRPAALDRGDYLLGMKGGRGSDEDGIDLLACEEFAIVSVSRNLLSDEGIHLGKARLVYIADAGDLDAGCAQKLTH
jgi:hypothetical protein